MSSNIRINKICGFCTLEFIAKTTVTNYCSDNCAKRAYKKRQRDKKIIEATAEFKQAKEQKITVSKEYLSIAETCSLFGISRWTLNRMMKKKLISFVKMGGRVVIEKKSFDYLFLNINL